MRAEIRQAAADTRGALEFMGVEVDLVRSAKTIRAFLGNLKNAAKGWRVVYRYAIGAVIGILDTLIEDQSR